MIIYIWWNFHITTVIMIVSKWLLLKHCMVESADRRYAGPT
ncbi:uncharacterized protein M6B38_399020 [Iris pallida]|uniref:Uncharacterized protein n=1 Tax=Iris pallida TaxID=29817 RepID=A0AAX6FUD5_IRIPA|nr:uncharacterized protein M6B38_415945 [Iris pallida]KAJ6820039.1 uncharacterized protein M6B38_399020 [Iris pallida]